MSSYDYKQSLYRHFHLDLLVRGVAHKLEMFKPEIVDVFDARVNLQHCSGKNTR